MERVLLEKKDITFYLFLYPFVIHRDAYWKSKSIMCKRSIKMLEDAFANKPIPKIDCPGKEIDGTIKVAEELGISETPTMVLPDGRVHMGSLPADQLVDFIYGKK